MMLAMKGAHIYAGSFRFDSDMLLQADHFWITSLIIGPSTHSVRLQL